MTTTAAGTTTDMAALLRHIPLDILSGGSFERIHDLLSADFVDHTFGQPAGVEGLIASWRILRDAFPDLRYELMTEVADGDRIAHRVRAAGTHRGEFLGVAATGRRVSWEEFHIVRHNGVRFVEHWGVVDVARLSAGLRHPAINRAGTVRVAIETVFGAGDLTAAEQFYAPNHREYAPFVEPVQPTQGPDAVRFVAARLRAAFPDLRVEVHDVLDDGDHLVARIDWTGTHRGDLGPFAATGRRISWTAVGIARMEGPRIVETRSLSDLPQHLAPSRSA